jgi:hypothetical protein
MTNDIKQFNKFINLRFWLVSPTSSPPDLAILTPKPLIIGSTIPDNGTMNRKPEIEISGSFVDEVASPGLTIRVTNMYTQIPIWQYEDSLIEIEAGYFSDTQTSVKLKGKIMTASQEKPSPDGITAFSIWLGDLSGMNNSLIHLHYSPTSGTTLDKLLNDVAHQLTESSGHFDYIVVYNDTDSSNATSQIVLEGSFDYDGSIKDLLDYTKSAYSLSIMVVGDQIRVAKEYGSFHDTTYDLTYVSTVTRHAKSWVIKAPWTPGILPNSTIRFSSEYAKQSLGGAVAGSTSIEQRVLTVDFEFSTVGKTNSMTLRTLG